MERLGDDVGKELRRFGSSAEMAAIVTAWARAVGEDVARNAWPARLSRDGVLHVHTSSSAWAFELTQLAAVVSGQLAASLGEAAPKGVRFAPGHLPEPAAESREQPVKAPPPPSRAARAEAAALVAGIGDEELREAVAKAAALSLEGAGSDR